MKTLGAALCIRDGVKYDFCFLECIRSLLPICDEVAVGFQETGDGTVELLESLQSKYPKIKLYEYPLDNPSRDWDWVMNFTNWVRERLNTEYCIQMDMDEVLHENSYALIQPYLEKHHPCSLRVQRWNFWRDAKHMIPFGKVCGHEVIRIGPANLWMPADTPHPKGQPMMNIEKIALNIHVHHYGFLRRPEAFFQKEKFLQTAFTGGYDKQLDAIEAKAGWRVDLRISQPCACDGRCRGLFHHP